MRPGRLALHVAVGLAMAVVAVCSATSAHRRHSGEGNHMKRTMKMGRTVHDMKPPETLCVFVYHSDRPGARVPGPATVWSCPFAYVSVSNYEGTSRAVELAKGDVRLLPNLLDFDIDLSGDHAAVRLSLRTAFRGDRVVSFTDGTHDSLAVPVAVFDGKVT